MAYAQIIQIKCSVTLIVLKYTYISELQGTNDHYLNQLLEWCLPTRVAYVEQFKILNTKHIIK